MLKKSEFTNDFGTHYSNLSYKIDALNLFALLSLALPIFHKKSIVIQNVYTYSCHLFSLTDILHHPDGPQSMKHFCRMSYDPL